MTSASEPRIAIIIPVYRHSVLVVEAIESSLLQAADIPVCVVVVNDGCPFAETDAVCRDYAATHPGRLVYLKKPNGGLADARNFGIRFVLSDVPSAEAIYMLDADNRLRPGAMARAMAELEAHPEAAWVYPNIDMFGLHKAFDYGGDYSALIHTQMNICEAGSLIRREVFEAGVFFDTAFRSGFEDWDFFLCAARAGFRGRNLEDFGLCYRKRPESMLADSERDGEGIKAALRTKHKDLSRPRTLLKLEHDECPRYAVHLPGSGRAIHCTDPLAPGARELSAADGEAIYWRAFAEPSRYHRPLVTIAMPRPVLDALHAIGLLHWVLWRLECSTLTGAIAVLDVQYTAEDRLTVTTEALEGASGVEGVASAIGQSQLDEVVADDTMGWMGTLATDSPKPAVLRTTLTIPGHWDGDDRLARKNTVSELLSVVSGLRNSPFAAVAGQSWHWRRVGIPLRAKANEIVRRTAKDAPVYPRVRDARCHVACVLPIVEFGGVEKVALQIAKGLKHHGLVLHLVLVGRDNGAISAEWRDTFETLNILDDPNLRTWGGGTETYFGTEIPRWASSGDHGLGLGLLNTYDAVLSFHGGAVAALMGELRRHGVQTAVSLHLNDLTQFGRPSGNTYLALAYEHAFDLVLPCSQTLAHWLHGQGIPGEKIITVRNAAGFDLEASRLQELLKDRAARDPDQPLRVLYLGRLDRQKGVHRLDAVMAATERSRLALTWRVVGKSIIESDAPEPPSRIVEIVEPAVTSADALAELYHWADVCVLLSSFEGLPLTIMEAMRQGVVVVATDVGANAEVVRDGENGYLVDLPHAVATCHDRLAALAADRSLLQQLSKAAAADAQTSDWLAATKPLADRLRGVKRLASCLTEAA